MLELDRHCWPLSALGAATEALARQAGLKPNSAEIIAFPEHWPRERRAELDQRLAEWGRRLGLEAEQVHVDYAQVEAMVAHAHPALLRIELDGRTRFLALLKSRRGRVQILTPDLKLVWLPLRAVADAYAEPLAARQREAVRMLLDGTGVPPRRRDRAERALLRERLGAHPIDGCWLLRLPPSRPFRQLLRQERVIGILWLLLLFFFLQYFAVLTGWWFVGRGALGGQSDAGWMLGWALMLFTEIPLRATNAYLQGLLTVGLGTALKKRLFFGALRLDGETVRLQGAGQLLSRVLESETIEVSALGGGFQVAVMLVELVLAFYVLSLSAAPLLLPLLLLLFALLSFLICRHHYRTNKRWADQRIGMTHDLIEKMVGHRTRLAQASRANWHLEEDRALRDYLGTSTSMDRSEVWMNAIVIRGWMVAAALGIGYAFLQDGSDRTGLTLALGGTLLARNGFTNLSQGFTQILTAMVAWQRVAPLFQAATAKSEAPPLTMPPEPRPDQPLLEAHNLTFHYAHRRDPILKGCDLSIARGDRLLLQGESGTGKSTLGALLTGIRDQDGGLLLFRGLDRDSLGARNWRRHVVAAPQFHENHVFSETFQFNLLMGRNWPPTHADIELATEICEELNLGPLLERMPGGMQQMVGETGWQLSHGERSRLYIARTLLQGADIVVLDESFAALDPDTLIAAMACVRKRAPALLVIAHP